MKIAVIGRPNVGKSTLFNRLIRQKSAIVGDMPGITRDRKIAKAELCGLTFHLIDTPGVDPFSKDSLAVSMNDQSLAAIEESDFVFFVIDAAEGITEYDKAIASWIRGAFKKVGNRTTILLKNKSEGKVFPQNPQILGFGDG
ncbi:MAG: 50S ribosome-binding GTPase, partial [Holosporaceae bacterium]|nr:50S ribosome-binding GTPase [Holosporaceae bacterium]